MAEGFSKIAGLGATARWRGEFPPRPRCIFLGPSKLFARGRSGSGRTAGNPITSRSCSGLNNLENISSIAARMAKPSRIYARRSRSEHRDARSRQSAGWTRINKSWDHMMENGQHGEAEKTFPRGDRYRRKSGSGRKPSHACGPAHTTLPICWREQVGCNRGSG